MDSIISTFHIDWKIIIAQAINFGVVFVVLYLFALKPLSKLMTERGERIAKGIEDAKINAAILKTTQTEYDEIIKKARAETDIIFQEGKKEAETKKALMLEKAKTEVAGMIENGQKTLEIQKVKIVEEAKKEIVSLAMLATRKLVEESNDRSLNEKSVKSLDNL